MYTIERHKPLLDEAEKRFQTLKLRNVMALAGDGMKGWLQPRGADPLLFDKIIVTAAARHEPPQALLDQLKDGGVMVIPVGENGDQVLRLYRRAGGDFPYKDLFPVRFVPLLPDMAGDESGNDRTGTA